MMLIVDTGFRWISLMSLRCNIRIICSNRCVVVCCIRNRIVVGGMGV